MKLAIQLNNVKHESSSIEGLAITIEYSIEEFTAIMAAWPEVIKTLIEYANAHQ